MNSTRALQFYMDGFKYACAFDFAHSLSEMEINHVLRNASIVNHFKINPTSASAMNNLHWCGGCVCMNTL